MKASTSTTSLTLPNGAVKQNRRVLLDDLAGRRYEYTVSPVRILGMTSYRDYDGVKYLSALAAIKECARRLTVEWRAEQ